jgi:hypothetical protein
MAVSFVGTGGWNVGVTSISPTIHASTAVGDLMVLTLVSKYDDAVLPSDPAGWTSLGVATNSGRPTGNDNGNMRERVFTRVFQAGDTGPSLAPTPNNVSIAKIDTYRSATGQYSVASQLLVDDTAGTPAVITATSTLGLTTGDYLHIDLTINGDVATFGTTTFSATGATFGAAQTLTDSSTATGTDLRYRRVHYAVSSGTATGNPTYSITLGGTTTNAVAIGAMVRIRENTSAFTGSASLSGSGTLVAAGTPRPAASVAPSGSGTLTTAGTPRPAASVTPSGSGALTTSGTPRPAASVTPSGSGTLAATGTVVATAALTGSGTLTAAATSIYADNFNRANSSSGLGSNWRHHDSTGAGITSNQFKVQNTFAGISRWGLEASTADHYAQLTVINTGAATLGPAVRMPALASSNGSTGDYYILTTNSTMTQVLIRRKDNNATSLTTLGSNVTTTVSSGDVLRLAAVGTELIGYVNGTEVIRRSTSLAPLTTGGRGVGLYASGVTDIVADNWSASDITIGSASLSGSGSLAAVGSPRPRTSAALSGSGTVTASGTPAVVVTAQSDPWDFGGLFAAVKMERLTSGFSAAEPAKFDTYGDVQYVGGRMRLADIGSGSGCWTEGSGGNNLFDLTDSYLMFELTNVPAVSTSAVVLDVYGFAGFPTPDDLCFIVEVTVTDGVAELHWYADGITPQTFAYDPAAHRWLRVRQVGTTQYFEARSAGGSWTTLASGTPSLPTTALYLGIDAYSNAGSPDPAEYFEIDNLNLDSTPLLTGSGTLAATGTVVTTAALAGAGSLAASGTPAVSRPASRTGSGTLSATPSISTVIDDFSTPSLGEGLPWSTFNGGTQTNGRLEVSVAPAGGAGYVDREGALALVGEIYFQLGFTANTESGIFFEVDDGYDGLDVVYQPSYGLRVGLWSGSYSTIMPASTTEAWVRIRATEAGAGASYVLTMYVDVFEDDAWTQKWSGSSAAGEWPNSHGYLSWWGGDYNVPSGTQTVWLDNVNINDPAVHKVGTAEFDDLPDTSSLTAGPKIATLSSELSAAEPEKLHTYGDVQYVDGRMRLTDIWFGAGFWTDYWYDLTESYLMFELTHVPTSNSEVVLDTYGKTTRYKLAFRIRVSVTNGVAELYWAAEGVTPVTVPYDPVAHRWLRVRQSGATQYFEARPAGGAWTTLGSGTPSTVLTALWVGFDAYGDDTDATKYFEIDNLNVEPGNGNNHTGSASLSGSGTLTTSGTPRPAASAALTGSGTATATATPSHTGSAPLTGSGSTTTAGTPAITSATAAPSGSGSTATAGTPTVSGATASPSGSGTLTAAGAASTVGSGTLSGSGATSASGRPSWSATSTLSGSGTLTGAGAPAAVGTASLAGSGTLGGIATPRPTGAASPTGSGTLSAVGTVLTAAAASGSGSLTGSGLPRHTGTATATGSGTVVATAIVGFAGAAGYSSSGIFSAAGSATGYTAVGNLSGLGGLTAVGRPAAASTVTTSGSGTASTSTIPAMVGVGSTTGSGGLGATGSPSILGAGALSGSGTLVTTATLRIIGATSPSGTGALVAAGTVVATATLSGSGTGAATGRPSLARAASLAGAGALTATGTVLTAAAVSGLGTLTGAGTPRHVGTATTSGSGTLGATASVSFTGLAGFSSSGILSASGSATGYTGVANLSGLGTLAGTGTAHVGATASVTGEGAVGATAAPAWAATAPLSGSGTASATASSHQTGTAPLSGPGTLTASGTVATSGSAALTGAGSATASSSPAWSTTVTLTGSGTLGAAGLPRFTSTTLALAGMGDLTTSGTPAPVATGSTTGAGSLAGTGTPAASTTAGPAGSGSLAATSTVVSAAGLAGSGTLTAAAQPTVATSASVTGSGALIAIPAGTGLALLVGSGELAAAGRSAATGGASLSGSGTLTVSATLGVAGSAAPSGPGNLTTTASSGQVGSASPTGSGSLAGAGRSRLAAATAVSGSGTLTAAGVEGQISSVELTGTGSVVAAGRPIVQGTAALASSGTLTTVGVPRPTTAGAPSSAGSLAASGAAGVATQAYLTSDGTLVSVAVPRLTGAANLAGAGSLAAAGGSLRDITVTSVLRKTWSADARVTTPEAEVPSATRTATARVATPEADLHVSWSARSHK